ncbi:MAG: hypothetical protein HYY24_07115 [Verrucomicrobia bacterium]|nr:hypothetical protein [Verrucomicrobiota bacterium]
MNESEQAKRASRLEIARRAFQEYFAQCFWSSDPNIVIQEEDIPFVVRGPRYHGGHKGYRIAAELCR